MNVQNQEQKFSVFNNEFHILELLGEGHSSRVYLGQHIHDPSQKVALKLFKNSFLIKEATGNAAIEKEIAILEELDHENITKILGYGSEGQIVKPSGRKILNYVYIILEYAPGGLLFDLCECVGGFGEDGTRYFMDQLANTMLYMHQEKGIVHRDLKLENMLVDENLNLKLADFGASRFTQLKNLSSFQGTQVYMPPEIKERKGYDGRKADIFSAGVCLYTMVSGNYPFTQANSKCEYYNLIINGQIQEYWQKMESQSDVEVSPYFKDLIIKMLDYDPAKRPSIEEVINHRWMQRQKINMSEVKEEIIQNLHHNNYQVQFQHENQDINDCESNCTQHSGDGSEDVELLKLVQKWSSTSQSGGDTTVSV